MLVQQFAGACLALLVAGTLGSGAAKARAIALGLLRRAIPLGAFPELLEIDGFPHDHLHQPNGQDSAKIPTPRKFSRMVSINSVCIGKIPRRLKKSGKTVSRAKTAYFCALPQTQHTGPRMASPTLPDMI
jgi:hypothetical protein